MNRKTKYIVIGIIGISCIGFLFYFSYFIVPLMQSSISQNYGDNRENQFEVTNITVIVDYSGVKANETFVNINLTNFETTAYHAVSNCCSVVIQQYSWGLYVKEINGVGTGWIYWVNNDPPPNIPANQFNLMDNDTVNWKHV